MKRIFLLIATLFAMGLYASDGATLYKKCAACHGMNGEKKALGKSQVITDWSKDEALRALMGYKEGDYGGSMKALMKAQVAPLSKEDLEKIAEHIDTLKK